MDADPPATDPAVRVRDLIRDARHAANARAGLTCWGREGDDRHWGLWRDAGDVNLVPWTDLGPQGMIWALWVNPGDPDDMVVALEFRDDSADPPVAHVRLLRLPGARLAEAVCSADPDLTVERFDRPDGAAPLFRWFPHGRGTADAGFGLLDLDLSPVMPPVIAHVLAYPNHQAEAVAGHPALLRYRHAQVPAPGGWGVFDLSAGRDVIPPIHTALDRDGARWVANLPDGTSALLDMGGTVLHRHAHALTLLADGTLCACLGGRWGRADATGALVADPVHLSLAALLDAPAPLGPLHPPSADDACAVLPAELVQRLQADSDRGIGGYPFEGLAGLIPGFGDAGEVVADPVVLSDGQPALRLVLRPGRARWLVLLHPWAGRPAGTLLRLAGRSGPRGTALRATPPDGADAAFLTTVLAPPGWQAAP